MHRNDWLPTAEFIADSRDGYAVTLVTMCMKTVTNRITLEEAVRTQNAAFCGTHFPSWRTVPGYVRGSYAATWTTPCRFKSGHPGKCGTEVPNIFDENGRVRPAIEKTFGRMRRRKDYGAATDH